MPTRILVVEDEPLIALDLKRRLGRMGYEVAATADSAETAIAAVAQHQPDLVLMDIRLRGDRSGIEAAAQIKESSPIPVVFLTAHADGVTLEQAKAVYPFGYIVKPFENEDLVTAIETALSRSQAELAIQNALIREKELTQLKSQFVSIVSHEFRNPLSIVLTSIDLLETYDQTLSTEDKQRYLRQARNSVGLMTQLLEEVLVLGEMAADKLQCHLTLLDVSELCQFLIEEVRSTIGSAHTIDFQEIRDQPNPVMVMADERLLRHILMNLLSNAVKYSPLEDGTERPIILRLTYQPDRLEFCVIDRGIGISPEDRTHLFESFYRGSNVNHISGTGLGLNIVQQCVDAYKGEISIDSQLAQGTTVTVIIPC
jgi:signal transduction histidine kinase